MKVDSLSGHIRLLVLLAEIVGSGSVAGAVLFFRRSPRPDNELIIPWFLVGVSMLFVVIIAAVLLYSFWYWRRAKSMEHDYWIMRSEQDGG